MPTLTLCSACLEIFADGSLDRYGVLCPRSLETEPGENSVESYRARVSRARLIHYPEAALHRRAVADGCPLCSWIPTNNDEEEYSTFWWWEIEQYDPSRPTTQLTLNLQGPSIHGSHRNAMTSTYLADSSNSVIRAEHFHSTTPESVETHLLANASLSVSNTRYPEVLQLAGAWLRQCTSMHSECPRASTNACRPTRLLELADGQARLIETTSHQIKQPYVTLSHCWGEFATFRLDRENAGELREGLPYQAFAPTFRDAMEIATSLGFKYIWIDSYCIFQDSEEDWAIQASSMDRVYANSALNIGAALGHDSGAGCFADRMVEEPRSLEVLWRKSVDSEPELYRLERDQRFTHDHVRRLFDQTLFTRGWIVQERHLAPRMLYFTNAGIFWECPSLKFASEWFPHGLYDVGLPFREACPGHLHRTGTSWSTNKRMEGYGIRSDQQYLHETLGTALQVYSLCSLSKPEKDKIVAFSGIARKVCAYLDDSYWNGFIESMLPYSLVWKADLPKVSVREPTSADSRPSIAASWHWASSNYPINMLYADRESKPKRIGVCNIALMPGHGPLVPDTRWTPKTPLVCIARLLQVSFMESNKIYGNAVRLFPLHGEARERGSLFDEARGLLCHGIKWYMDRHDLEHGKDPQSRNVFLLPVWSSYQIASFRGQTPNSEVLHPSTARLLGVQQGKRSSQTLYEAERPIHISGGGELYPHKGLVLCRLGDGCFSRIGMYHGDRLPCAIEIFEAMRLAKPQLVIIK